MSVSLVPAHARWSFPAGTASLQQFQFVGINSSGQIVAPAASGVYALVLDDAPSVAAATGTTADMPTGGYTVGAYYGCVFSSICVMKVLTGANLTAGTAVMTNTSGAAIAATGTGVVLGYAIAASNSGDITYIAPA